MAKTIKSEKTTKKTLESKLYSLEVEQTVLACILVDGEPYSITEDIFSKIEIADFYLESFRNIFISMLNLFTKGITINLIVLNEKLENQGLNYLQTLTEIANLIPSNANYKYYLELLKEYSLRRKLFDIGKYVKTAIESGEESTQAINGIQGLINALEAKNSGDIEHIRGTAISELARIKERMNGKSDDFGLATGFRNLDRQLWGLQKSDLVIVGARAGTGKTAFALNILANAGIMNKKSCLFFSLEMAKAQIIKRFYAIQTGINNHDLLSGQNLDDKMNKITEAQARMQFSKLYIDDNSQNTPASMLLKAKQFQRKNGLDLIVIDYLQFVKPTEATGNRFQDVGNIARELKVMARTLNVPVLVLCQLSRSLDKEDRDPELADLRESGEIENNADIIMFLQSKSSRYSEIKDITLHIGKFRNGATAGIKFKYTGSCFTFKEC